MAEGYKTFLAATVLDGGDLTDFCSSQAVMRFANAAGRDAALTVSIVKEGMLAYLKDTDVLQANIDSTLTGWRQVYPVITATITDGNVTAAKMAANSISSANIIDGTIVGADIAATTITGSNIAAGTIAGSNIIDGTVTGADIAATTITGSNIAAGTVTSANILDATITAADIAASTITGSNIAAGTITGSNIASGTVTSANILDGTIAPADLAAGTYAISISGNAATASDSALLDGFDSSYAATNSSIPVRGSSSQDILAGSFVTNDSTTNQFYNNGTYTQIGQFTARVVNASTVFAQPVTSARTVLINSAGTLGTSVSSRRYKDNIELLPTDVDKILQLDPVTFFYKPELYEPDQTRRLEIGLIAEQAAELGLEQLVDRNANGQPEAIAYEKLAVYLLKVCKTQQTQIDALGARLEAIGA